jgi:hypothetical protein
MMVVGMALAFCGLTMLALSMERHHEPIMATLRRAPRPLACRLLGWALVCLAAAPALDEYGASIGTAVWVGELSLAAASVLLLLSYAPRTIPLLLMLVPALAIAYRLLAH